MKRMILFLLILGTMLTLTACQEETARQQSFYYLRTEDTIAYGREDALIVAVPQEFSPETELEILLQLYLDGPVDEDHRNPFPRRTYLLSTIEHGDTLLVVLSREFSTLDGMQLTLAKTAEIGLHDLPGCTFPLGSTGVFSVGDGRFYFSDPISNPEEKTFSSTVHLYRMDETNPQLFTLCE